MNFLTRYTLIKSLLAIVLTGLASGCSYKAGHDTLHNIAKDNCRNMINPQERQQCELQHKQADYKAYRYEYEKSR